MNVRWTCPNCETANRTAVLTDDGEFHCNCGFRQAVHEGTLAKGKILGCLLCKTEDLYFQKDFPERVGMAIVATGFVLATVAWAYYSPFATFGVLFGFFFIDAALFYTRKNVTVCYRCLAQFRGMTANEAHKAFDLGIGERYRQERLRKAERRQQGLAPVPLPRPLGLEPQTPTPVPQQSAD